MSLAVSQQGKVVTRPPWLAHVAKKILYAKLTYCDHPNKNVEHPDLRIIKN